MPVNAPAPPKAPRLVTRSELARIARVTPAAITKAAGLLLAPACVGSRLDLNDPTVAEYLARRGIAVPDVLEQAPARVRPVKADRPQKPPRTPPAVSHEPANEGPRTPSAPPAPSPKPHAPAADRQAAPAEAAPAPVRLVSRELVNLDEVADMTIRQVVAQFGTVTGFKDWLLALQTIENVRDKKLRNAEADGSLISIRLVRTHVMGALDAGYRRLLTDTPKTIARRVYSAARSDVPLEHAEAIVREVISSQLDPMKDAAARGLRERQPTPTE